MAGDSTKLSRKRKNDEIYDRKSKYNKHKKNQKPYMVIVKSPTSFRPDIYVCKHKYAVQFALTSTSGAVANQIIGGNNLESPISTAIQPVGYDELKIMYKNYTVTGSSIKVRVCPRAVVGADIAVMPYFASSLTSPATMTCAQISQQPFAKRRYQFLYDALELNQYVSTSKLAGVTPEQVLANFVGVVGSAPTNQWNWIISYQTADLASTSTVDVIVDIVYYTRWTSPATITDIPPS